MAISLLRSVCSDVGRLSTELKNNGEAVASYRLQESKTEIQIKASILEVTVGLGRKFSVSFAVHSNEIFPHLYAALFSARGSG